MAQSTRGGDPGGGRATLKAGNCRESARNPLGVTKWGPKLPPTGRASGSFPRGPTRDAEQRGCGPHSRDLTQSCYCFSYNETTSTGFPFASVPFVVVVRVFPSAETTMVEVAVTFPPCLLVIRVVFASTRVRATTSP